MQEQIKPKQHSTRYLIQLTGLCFLILSLNSCFFDKELKQDEHIESFRDRMLHVLDSLDKPVERIKAVETILEEIKNDKDIITERKKNNIIIEGLFHISNEYYKLEQFDSAIKVSNDILTINPQNAGAYYNRGVAYQAKQELAHALEDYTKAIDLKTDYIDAYYNRGLVYEKTNKYNLALLDYDKVIKLKPSYVANVYVGLGNAYRGLNNLDKAVENYSKAIKIDTFNIEALSNMGSVMVESAKYEEAVEHYSLAISLDSTNADLYDKRGYTYELMKDYEKALLNYQKAVDTDTSKLEIYKDLAHDGIKRVKLLKKKLRK